MKIDVRSKAVIYPANTVSGYAHIYSLGIPGVSVTALSPVNCGNFRSRYVREAVVVPDPCVDHERFLHALIDYGRKQSEKPVLFMVEDLYAYIASLYRSELEHYYLFPYVRLDALDILFHKRSMYKTATAAGIRVPETLYADASAEAIDTWSSWPAVVKPTVSRFTFRDGALQGVCDFPRLFGGKAVFAAGRDELQTVVNKLSQTNIDWCIQEYVPGDNHCLYTIYFVAEDRGEIRSFSTHYKVRQQPADFGTTAVSRSKAIPQLRGYAESFCRKVGYAGPGTMEFKRSERDGEWYLMEINPRLGFAVRRSTVNGVNIVLQQYLFSTGQKMLHMLQRDGGRPWIDFSGDIKGLMWRRGKRQWKQGMMKIVNPYLFFHEAVFNLRDPVPGSIRLVKSTVSALRRLAGNVFRRFVGRRR